MVNVEKVHETVHHHETEEVLRQKEVDRHVHHVQHHVQPINVTDHQNEIHHERNVPLTNIREKHVATDDDVAVRFLHSFSLLFLTYSQWNRTYID